MLEFEDFQEKAAGMFSETDDILLESWKDKERTKRLVERYDQKQAVEITKPKRSIQPSEKFG